MRTITKYNKLTNEGNVNVGVQSSLDQNEDAGVFRTLDGDGNYADFTHYQYGPTIRTNKNIFEFFIGDSPTDYGTLSIRRNTPGVGAYGARLQVRDRDDIGGVELSGVNLHAGSSHLIVDFGYNGGIFDIKNDQTNGVIRFYCDSINVFKIDKIGLYLETTKLGVGTTNPRSKIHSLITGTPTDGLTGSGLVIQNSNAGQSSYATIIGGYNANSGIVFTDEGQGYKGRIVYNNLNHTLDFFANNVGNLRITSTGVRFTSLPTYADEAAAIVGGLTTGFIYKTVSGDLKIKL